MFFPYISTLAIFFTSKSVENDFKRTGKNTVAAETGGVCVQGEGETFLLQMWENGPVSLSLSVWTV